MLRPPEGLLGSLVPFGGPRPDVKIFFRLNKNLNTLLIKKLGLNIIVRAR